MKKTSRDQNTRSSIASNNDPETIALNRKFTYSHSFDAVPTTNNETIEDETTPKKDKVRQSKEHGKTRPGHTILYDSDILLNYRSQEPTGRQKRTVTPKPTPTLSLVMPKKIKLDSPLFHHQTVIQ